MANILILSCNNGGGHNSVAHALSELFTANGDTAVIRDTLSYVSSSYSRFLQNVHVTMYRDAPELNRLYYRYSEQHRNVLNPGHPAREALRPGLRALARELVKGKYDAVLCTHVFAGVMMSDVKARYHFSVPFGLVETDYTVTPGVESCAASWYFVPSSLQAADLTGLGADASRVVVSGIPVLQSLKSPLSREQARALLGRDNRRKNILVMFGSMGCGPIPDIVREVSARMEQDTDLDVVCGSNEDLYRNLSGSLQGRSAIHLHGLVKDMGPLLASADLLITKPGGITTTEAVVSSLPMVLLDTVGGCEECNRRFLTAAGCAVSGSDPESLALQAADLLNNEAGLQSMKEAQKRLSSENRPERILETIRQYSAAG